MARQGITAQQVYETAEHLIENGQPVTVPAIREVLGTGSFSTISAHLAKWKEAGGSRRPVADVPEMPDPVERAARAFWATAWKDAQGDLHREREALDLTRREMEREKGDMAAEILRLETENGTLSDTLARLQHDLEEQTAARATAEATTSALRIENARLDERAKAADALTEELRGELKEVHARFRELSERVTRETPRPQPVRASRTKTPSSQSGSEPKTPKPG